MTGFESNVDSGEMPSLQRGREHERLERRAGLTLALHGEVELARVEAPPAVPSRDCAVRRVDRDERRLRPGRARQPLVDRVARELLQAEVDRRVHAKPPPNTRFAPNCLSERSCCFTYSPKYGAWPRTPERWTSCGFGIGASTAWRNLPALMIPCCSIRRSTVRRRLSAVRGCATGSYRLGSSGMPARSAASGNVSFLALWPKYVRDARSTPYAPLPK